MNHSASSVAFVVVGAYDSICLAKCRKQSMGLRHYNGLCNQLLRQSYPLLKKYNTALYMIVVYFK
jgi:hypothetical protein